MIRLQRFACRQLALYHTYTPHELISTLVNTPGSRSDTGIEQDDYFSTLGKAFVGLRLMLEAYPTKKWFVVLGDDNYVLLDNYINALSAFDPEEPLALSRMVHRNKFGCKVLVRVGVEKKAMSIPD